MYIDDVFTQWRLSLRPKQKKRAYQHLDTSLDLDNDGDFEVVKRAIVNLRIHQFLPFLKFIKADIRYRKDSTGTLRRKIKQRPIMYASHLDAHIYGFFSYIWGQAYEQYIVKHGISDNVIAYRKISEGLGRNKGNIQFAREVFQYIQEQGDCVAIVADISKFFDTLKHKTLKEQLCAVLGKEKLSPEEYKVFRSLSAFRFILKDKDWGSPYSRLASRIARGLKGGKSVVQAVYESGKKIIKINKTEIGIPQGSPVSGLLANIYLSTFDISIHGAFPNTLYRRYSDDIVLVCPTAVADKLLSVLKTEIEKYDLDINPEKVFIVTFKRNDKGIVACVDVQDGNYNHVGKKHVDYLGFEFNGKDVLLRNKTLQRTYKKADRKISKHHLRQTNKYKHKPHKPRRVQKSNSYIKNAVSTMQIVGSKISSQHEKFEKFVRRSKRNAKVQSIKTA